MNSIEFQKIGNRTINSNLKVLSLGKGLGYRPKLGNQSNLPGLHQHHRKIPYFAFIIYVICPHVFHIHHFYQYLCYIFNIKTCSVGSLQYPRISQVRVVLSNTTLHLVCLFMMWIYLLLHGVLNGIFTINKFNFIKEQIVKKLCVKFPYICMFG